MKILIF